MRSECTTNAVSSVHCRSLVTAKPFGVATFSTEPVAKQLVTILFPAFSL
jgi:hypothetical protein